MRIGIDIRAVGGERAGIGNYVYNLIKAILQIDKENYYVLFGFTFKFYENTTDICKILSDGRANIKIKVSRIPWNVVNFLWKYSSFVPPQLYYEKLDVTHFPSYPTITHSKGKLIATIYDLTPLKFPGLHIPNVVSSWSEKAKAFIKDRIDMIIAVSENTKNDIMEILKIPNDRIRVIHGAVRQEYKEIKNKKLLKEILTKYNIDCPYILTIGTLEPRKNHVRLIKAFSFLEKEFCVNENYKLVIVGKRGWLYKDICRIVEELKLRNKIIFTGYIQDEDIPPLINGASLFVYPSLYEGFGLPPLEAAACGTPVITSNISSLPEVMGDGAILIDPHDVEGMAEAMYAVLTDNRLSQMLRKKGKDQAKKFSWEKTAEKTLKVYKEAMCN